MWTVYFSGLVLGLSSSLHCLGMCGPLVAAVPMKSQSSYSQVLGITQYHIGKTTTYALLGLLMGFVGLSLQTLQWMQILSIISGLAIIFFAWAKYIKFKSGTKIQQLYTRYSGKALHKLFKSDIPFKPFWFGLINGLLPCGLVYIALINSLLAGNPLSSSFAMIFFGLGTIPILTVARFVSNKISWKTNRITPVIITIVGLMVVFRGLNLGIPYLSPKIETKITKSNNNIKEEVQMECCHKKNACH
jgi:hypothetical protein